MPFGLSNAPSMFERLMDKVFQGLNPDICLIYLDEIIVKGTFEKHLHNVKQVFHRLRSAGLKLLPKNTKKAYITRPQRVQNALCCMVFKLNKYCHVTPLMHIHYTSSHSLPYIVQVQSPYL